MIKAYEFEGKCGYIRVFLLNKKERTDPEKNDGIRLEIKSDNINIKNSNILRLDLKDWEALSVITGLSESLVRKKLKRKGYKIVQ